MPTRTPVAVFVLSAAVAATSAAADTVRSPLHGALEPGPHRVGFTVITVNDATRPSGPKRDAAGKPIDAARRTRSIDVHVWYPAMGGATPMTLADYTGADAAARRERQERLRRFLGEFGTVTDDAWTRLLAMPLLAARDAAPAAGRFPLLVGHLREFSTTVTNEYLASHGYVVAMARTPREPDPPVSGAGLEIGVRDMEAAIPALRALPYVDQAALGTFGFSGNGFSQILLAMRHPDIDAVCDLESAIFDSRMMWPLSTGWGYDVAALRVPFLHTYGAELAKRENRIGDFEKMRYSPRHHLVVDAPRLHHWDFATEGMAASVLRLRGDDSVKTQLAFETTNRYVRAFFDGYVKRDATGLAFLRRDPVANGAPAGLATIRELPAVTPAPTPDALFTVFNARGEAEGMRELEGALARDPDASVFREDNLNQIGYWLLRNKKYPESFAIFRKAIGLFPSSSNLLDSLAEALETSGDKAAAIETTRKALEVLAKQEMSDEARTEARSGLEARLKRLE